MPRGLVSSEERQRRIALRTARSEERKKARDNRRVRVGKWAVYELDELNWVVEQEGNAGSRRYYPSLLWALKGLLDVRLGETAAGDLSGVLDAVETAKSEILTALSRNPGRS